MWWITCSPVWWIRPCIISVLQGHVFFFFFFFAPDGGRWDSLIESRAFHKRNVYQSTVWLTLISFRHWKSSKGPRSKPSPLCPEETKTSRGEFLELGGVFRLWSTNIYICGPCNVCHCILLTSFSCWTGCYNLFVQVVVFTFSHRSAF